jgi:hypothetical protein
MEFDKLVIPDLSGKSILITGASTGIGQRWRAPLPPRAPWLACITIPVPRPRKRWRRIFVRRAARWR